MSSFKSQIGCLSLQLGFFHSFISLLLRHVSLDRGGLAICLELVASGLTAGGDLISSWFDNSRDHPLCFWLVSQIWERMSVVSTCLFFPARTGRWLVRILHCGNKFSTCAEWREYMRAGWAGKNNILIELRVPFFIMPGGDGYALRTPGRHYCHECIWLTRFYPDQVENLYIFILIIWFGCLDTLFPFNTL